MKQRGKIVAFTDKNGQTQQAIAYNHEQSDAFINVKKVFIRYVNDDFSFKTDEKGEKLVGLISTEKLKVIGFTD